MSRQIEHVAIIMDGNGRWAKARHLPRVAGHRAGVKSVRVAIEYCLSHHIKCLTLFTLSTENLSNRPPAEIEHLFELFISALSENIDSLHEQQVRLQIVGDRLHLSEKLQNKICDVESATRHNKALTLTLALNYSGRWDIVQAATQLATALNTGRITASEIDASLFSQYVSCADLPEPDLLIRTGKEQRISNFFLWQLAYTELYFSDQLWPDFKAECFQAAVDAYSLRERRFGHVGH